MFKDRTVKQVRVAAAVLIGLQVLDVLTTNSVLAHGGIEGNPIMHIVQSNLGSFWWLPKILFVSLVAGYVVSYPTRVLSKWIFAIVGVYAITVLNNFAAMFSHGAL